MSGWIKVHRDLMDKPIWLESTPEQKTILITLLMMANHKEKEWEWQGEPYKVGPGQFITSLESISHKAGKGISVQNIRTALNRFEKYNFLTNKSTNKNRLITIVNWAIYQKEDEELTSESTGIQQATNKQLTTNKNDIRMIKNEKNIKPSSRKRVYDKESIHYQLANRLFSKIRENNPDFKEPSLQKWSDDVRLMMERDKRSEKQITFLIDWVQQDSFWKSNILSTAKLRKQFDQLVIKIKSERENPKKLNNQRKLISLEKPDHVKDPELPEDIDERINEMLEKIDE